jgi:hypothetical protein
MDNSIRPERFDRSRRGRGDNQGDKLLKEELNQLAEQLVEVAEEMETVSREDSTLEDIEGCKVLAAGVLGKYSALHNRLGEHDRMELEQSIGPAVDRIKKGLTLLKEAPE